MRTPDGVKAVCGVDSVSQRLAAQSYLDLTLTAVVRDEMGRQLDNFSSVELLWSLSDGRLAQLTSHNSVLVQTRDADGYRLLGPSNHRHLPIAPPPPQHL